MIFSSIKMPFGRFKGEYIVDLPSDYLKWVAGYINDEDIAEAADEEYRLRTALNEHWYEKV